MLPKILLIFRFWLFISVRFNRKWIQTFCVRSFGLDSVSSKIQKFRNLFVSEIFGDIAHNGKGLCEVRATATGISRGDRTLVKNFFHFLKLRKTKKWKSFLRVFSKIFLRFPSTPHLAKPMLAEVVFYCLVSTTSSGNVLPVP